MGTSVPPWFIPEPVVIPPHPLVPRYTLCVTQIHVVGVFSVKLGRTIMHTLWKATWLPLGSSRPPTVSLDEIAPPGKIHSLFFIPALGLAEYLLHFSTLIKLIGG